MNEIDFMHAVQGVFAREIAKGKSPSAAHRAADRFRVDLIVSLAQAALTRSQSDK